MALELTMCANGAIDHASGSSVSGGTFVITPLQESTLVKTESYGVYKGTLAFSFTGGSASGFVPNSLFVVSGSIPATVGIKTKAENQPVIRLGDIETITFTGVTLPNPPGTSGTIPGDVEVTNAGQTTSRAQ